MDYSLDVVREDNVQYHIVYGDNVEIDRALFIPSDSVMFETGIRSVRPTGEGEGQDFRMFTEDHRGLGYDLFAMTFYMLSRYEEYYEKDYDNYGRIVAQRLDPIQHRFVDIPLLDVLILSMTKILNDRFPMLQFVRKEYEVLPGIDIDFMYLFQHRNVIRKVFSLSNSILKKDFGRARDFLVSIFQEKEDPYARFEDWLPMLKEKSGTKNVFVLSALKNLSVDNNLSPKHQLFSQWLKNLEVIKDLYVGWHPSVQAGSDRLKLAEEKSSLEEVLGYKIEKSRQHFVSFRLPETYRSLLSLGIKEEHSMGFNDRSGFRASTAYPFYWYDILEEKKTNLKVFPFIFMDVQLRGYLGLDIGQSMEVIGRFKEQLAQTGGMLSFIWHNSSFYENGGWAGWRKVYEFSLRKR